MIDRKPKTLSDIKKYREDPTIKTDLAVGERLPNVEVQRRMKYWLERENAAEEEKKRRARVEAASTRKPYKKPVPPMPKIDYDKEARQQQEIDRIVSNMRRPVRPTGTLKLFQPEPDPDLGKGIMTLAKRKKW
jgi:hypothetical protein